MKKLVKQFFLALTIAFILMNTVAFLHAYKFTHFATEAINETKSPEKLNYFNKVKILLFGFNNPRPLNKKMPSKYLHIKILSNKKIDCWYLNKSENTKGTVILFHGYSGEKSSMLDKANAFEKLNYKTLLIDFMGSGGSEGNQTTLGFKEAEEVKSAFDYLTSRGEKNIFLFGTSMGAVAIMKSISDYNLKPKGIILECPFGSIYQATCARFKIMNVPTFPMAGLLVFWSGVQNNYWAFGHNPTEYAKKINYPTLLLYGEQDKKVSRQEINNIYKNLNGTKKLKTYKLAGHENYLLKYKEQWTKDIKEFLQTK